VKTVVIDVPPALIAPVQHGLKDGGAEERLLRLADCWLVRHPGATVLCSATYVLAESKG
jgi:hypothetical protein